MEEETVLGVIGGLGPLATAHFLELTTNMTRAPRDQDHVSMIIYDFPGIPDRTGYLLGSNLRSPLPGLLHIARTLEAQGAGYLAIPCITAHYFYDDLTQALRIPVISAVEETVLELKNAGVSRAGILATEGTVRAGIFSDALQKAGISAVTPGPDRQADVSHLIYQNIKAGRPPEPDRFHRAEAELRQQGAEVIILGCTELSLLKRDIPLGPGFLDALAVLARESILRCGKAVRPSCRSLITTGKRD